MMTVSYTVLSLEQAFTGAYILRVQPTEGKVFAFLPGQFCQLTLPANRTTKPHFFSIASSPTQTDYLEFSFKVYGDWTRQLSQQKVGEAIEIKGPFGKFTWEKTISHAVFLAGGMGIVPFMGMLRFIAATHQQPSITLLYGNRTEDQILYRKEIESIVHMLPESTVVHILSDVPKETAWKGYSGFITSKILQKEIDFSLKPLFFLCGPPIFTQLMQTLLQELDVDATAIRQELFT